MIRNPIRRVGGGGEIIGPYDVADLPNPTTNEGRIVVCSDGADGFPCLAAVVDGVWLRSATFGAPVSASALIDPLDVSGLVGWYAADKVTGLSNLDDVSLWEDFSGSGNDAATSGAAPVYRTNQYNSILPTIRFSSSGNQLNAPLLTTSLEYTMIAVCTLSGISGGSVIASNGAFTSNGWALACDNTSFQGVYSGSAFGPSYTPASSSGLKVVVLRRSGTTTTTYINGVSQGTFTDVPVTPTTGFYIGSGAGYSLNGDICELLVWNNAINTTTLANLTTQLKTKYDIG